MANPYLLIVAGPTASGKGSLPDKVIEDLQLGGAINVKLLIDDYVEQNPYYKDKVTNFIKSKQNSGMTNDKIKELFLSPTDELIETFKQYYFTGRDSTNCDTGIQNDNNPESGNCYNKLEADFITALNERKNIIFETTGMNSPSWIFDEYRSKLDSGNYNIIMAWTIVEVCELLKRNKSRMIEALDNYFKGEGSTPRMTDTTPESYIIGVNKIITTFLEINRDNNKNKFYEGKNVRLLLYDNNERPSKLIYDNEDKEKNNHLKIHNYNIRKAEGGANCGSDEQVHTSESLNNTSSQEGGYRVKKYKINSKKHRKSKRKKKNKKSKRQKKSKHSNNSKKK